jgi:RNA polymerase sigma-54 factor
MRQSLEILQMSPKELLTLIKKECAKNPTIEVEDRPRDSRKFNAESSDIHREMLENIEGTASLEEHLLAQVPDWNDCERKILLKLLESINERGFFDGNLKKIAADLDTKFQRVEWVYEELKKLHPHGIGAKNLRECLLLQLNQNAGNKNLPLAKTLVEKFFGELQNGKIEFICKKLKLPLARVVETGKFIAKLNFSPISGFSNSRSVAIIPDLKIFKSDGQWLIEFNGDEIPIIRFSKLYREIACTNGNMDQEAWSFLRKQAKAGKCLCDAIDRRKLTLLEIAKIIVSHQVEFFEKGPKFMRPLRLKDVAEKTKLHTSTISRAVRGKYVHTPHGICEMSKFFDSGVSESISQSAILERIREIVHSGNGKLSDEMIVKILAQQEICIARRTVAKYRKMINIPNSRMFKLSCGIRSQR